MVPTSQNFCIPEVDAHNPSEVSVDARLSLAQRRPRCQVRIPKRYQDDPPQPPPTLPPLPYTTRCGTRKEICDGSSSTLGQDGSALIPGGYVPCADKESGNHPILRSSCNVFGLLCCYYNMGFPSHDPEEFNDFNALSDVDSLHHEVNFGPYPNYSSFALSKWYWADGVQKSKQSFKNLLNIITGPDFKAEDVRDTKWDSIDDVLGQDEDSVWEDEDSAGWEQTSVTIQIPFHRFTSSPGLQEYTVHNFRHQSVVSILKEKLADNHEFQHFHLEPYKLRWQPRRPGSVPRPDTEDPSIQVHGELYTSPAFLKSTQRDSGVTGRTWMQPAMHCCWIDVCF